MTPIRRLTQAVLVALFMILGVAAPISADHSSIQANCPTERRCDWD